MSENKKELKFKVGDIVQIKQTVNIYQELANCGINNRIIDPPIPTMPDNLYNALLLDTAVILETNTTDFLPYLVLFREINKKFYISEELLELAFTSNEVSNNKKIKIKYHEPITPLENINGANSDWIDLRYSETKEKEPKPETTTISKENITNSIEQIMLVKGLLKETLKNADLIVKVFQTRYGINFNDFVKKPELITDNETRFLYLFTKLTMECIENVGGCLNKVIAELGNPEVDEKTE